MCISKTIHNPHVNKYLRECDYDCDECDCDCDCCFLIFSLYHGSWIMYHLGGYYVALPIVSLFHCSIVPLFHCSEKHKHTRC
jgi:hypothetical protein